MKYIKYSHNTAVIRKISELSFCIYNNINDTITF